LEARAEAHRAGPAARAEDAVTTLSGDGWRGEFGGTTPVQGLGEVDGRRFYFRARWEEWSLSVAEEGKDPLDVFPYGEGGFHHEEEWPGGPFQAGWMELTDVQKCMERAVAIFRAATRGEVAS
jgi:hypothetical protein